MIFRSVSATCRPLGVAWIALGAALALGACADNRVASSSSKPAQRSTSAPVKPGGVYKVGNPYQVAGVWYYPKEDPSYDETGIASWYGPGFHGKTTANGEQYDQNDLTAAHQTLPMPVWVRVTNLENGRSIVVRVNDRGPYANNRIIDMSRKAAQLLGYEQKGTARVRVQYVGSAAEPTIMTAEADPNPPQVSAAPRSAIDSAALPPPVIVQSPQAQARAARQPAPPPQPTQSQPTLKMPSQSGALAATLPPSATSAKSAPPAVAGARPAVSADDSAPVDYVAQRVTMEPARPTSIYVQVGAFTVFENASKLSIKMKRYGESSVSSSVVNGIDYYRVRVGPIENTDRADEILNDIIAAGETQARIVIVE